MSEYGQVWEKIHAVREELSCRLGVPVSDLDRLTNATRKANMVEFRAQLAADDKRVVDDLLLQWAQLEERADRLDPETGNEREETRMVDVVWNEREETRMVDVVWNSDEPKEYRASGQGWTMEVENRGPSGWTWEVKVTSPDITATGSELKSHEAKEVAQDILRRLLQAFPPKGS